MYGNQKCYFDENRRLEIITLRHTRNDNNLEWKILNNWLLKHISAIYMIYPMMHATHLFLFFLFSVFLWQQYFIDLNQNTRQMNETKKNYLNYSSFIDNIFIEFSMSDKWKRFFNIQQWHATNSGTSNYLKTAI